MPRKAIPLIERFFSRIERLENFCWKWTGTVGSRGYGLIGGRLKEEQFYVHRIAFETFREPIPEGMTVDHRCKFKLCVNPFHLRLLTLSENAIDGNAFHKAKTHCPKGHPYDAENTIIRHLPGGTLGRGCRECARISCLRYYYERKARTA